MKSTAWPVIQSGLRITKTGTISFGRKGPADFMSVAVELWEDKYSYSFLARLISDESA